MRDNVSPKDQAAVFPQGWSASTLRAVAHTGKLSGMAVVCENIGIAGILEMFPLL